MSQSGHEQPQPGETSAGSQTFFERNNKLIEKALQKFNVGTSVVEGAGAVIEAIDVYTTEAAHNPIPVSGGRRKKIFLPMGLTKGHELLPNRREATYGQVIVAGDTVSHNNHALRDARHAIDITAKQNPVGALTEVLLLGSDRNVLWKKRGNSGVKSSINALWELYPNDELWAKPLKELLGEGKFKEIRSELGDETSALRIAALVQLAPLAQTNTERRSDNLHGDPYRYSFYRDEDPVTLFHASARAPKAYHHHLERDITEWAHLVRPAQHDSVLLLAPSPRRLRLARFVSHVFASQFGWRGELVARGPSAAEGLTANDYLDEIAGNLRLDEAGYPLEV